MLLMNLLKQFLKSISIAKEKKFKKMKKHFNKSLILSEEEEEFQSSNTCWVCENLIDYDGEEVRDHYHITGKFRGAAHWSFNINL